MPRGQYAMLRDYQQNAVDAVINFTKKSIEPCLITAATGAGKSHIIAALASFFVEASNGKKVLILQPSKELVEQNYSKYISSGGGASLFSASLKKFETDSPAIYATAQTVRTRIKKFIGMQLSAIVIDEAHGVTPTIRQIVKELRADNTTLRVIGLTATPYRLGTGWIYAYDVDDTAMESTRDPYFFKNVYEIGAQDLIARGYLTPPSCVPTTLNYDTTGLQRTLLGTFTSSSVDRAFVGKGRLTSDIIADVVAKSQNRQSVMLFCANIAHAEEVLASLPVQLSRLVTGETKQAQRAKILQDFKNLTIKYIVNVDVLTTGFDAPSVDVIALLRHTESVGLLQQMIGRGLRLYDGKQDCLVLDHAGNIDKHCPRGDIFDPAIKTTKGGFGGDRIDAVCPICGYSNNFAERGEEDFCYKDEPVDKYGYYTTSHTPAHYGRRCQGYEQKGGVAVQCDYRWAGKKCENCGTDNDIAARRCHKCKYELVDPNVKLQKSFAKFLKDPTKLHTSEVLDFKSSLKVSATGNLCLKCNVKTKYISFVYYIVVDTWRHELYLKSLPIQTITYCFNTQTGFYDVKGYNQEPDTIDNTIWAF